MTALSPREKLLLLTGTALIGVTRVFAASRTMWEWDEALFAAAVREYDLMNHTPHPPGFPLFIGLAKMVHLVVDSEFRALQVVAVAGAIALFPAAFFLGRALRFSFRTSFLAALVFVFFPNTWYFGGTAFSDVPALALALGGCAAMIHGASDRRAFFAGAVLFALSLSIRPQNALLALAPGIYAAWRTMRVSWRTIAVSAVAAAVIVAASYGLAALASGSVSGSLSAIERQRVYVQTTDSWQSARRAPLRELARDFLLAPMRGDDRATVAGCLALAGILAGVIGRNRFGVTMTLLIFAPLALFSWLMLDMNAVTRYSVSYSAAHALLAAAGVAALTAFPGRWAGALEIVMMSILAAAFASWTLPAIREVRSRPAPSFAVIDELKRSAPQEASLFVSHGLGPFFYYLLPGRDVTYVEGVTEIPADATGFLAIDHSIVAQRGGKRFVRDDGRTWQIARRRYYVASLVPLHAIARFGEGWYGDETYGTRTVRWMSARGEVSLPPSPGRTLLMLDIEVPEELVAARPAISVMLNGRALGRIEVAGVYTKRQWHVEARPDGRNELVITIDRVFNPARDAGRTDPRDLGLKLLDYAWRPAG